MSACYIDTSKAAADSRMTHEASQATSRPSSTISGSWDCRTRAIKRVFKRFPADIENNDIACCNIGINIAKKRGDIPVFRDSGIAFSTYC
jgi:hypothetical protein